MPTSTPRPGGKRPTAERLHYTAAALIERLDYEDRDWRTNGRFRPPTPKRKTWLVMARVGQRTEQLRYGKVPPEVPLELSGPQLWAFLLGSEDGGERSIVTLDKHHTEELARIKARAGAK